MVSVICDSANLVRSHKSLLQNRFHSLNVQDAAGSGATLLVYFSDAVTLVVPRDVAAVVGLLPHSLRGCLSKLRIKTTANAQLTEQLGRAGTTAKAFLTLDALKALIASRLGAEQAELLADKIQVLLAKAQESEDDGERRAAEPLLMEEVDEEDEEDDNFMELVSEVEDELYVEDEEELAANYQLSDEAATPSPPSREQPPPILVAAPVPLPQSPMLNLPTRGWTADDWSGKRFTLKHYDMGAVLKKQIKDYRRYWGNTHVLNRKGGKLSSVTIEKRVERLLGYIGFLKEAKAVADARTLTLEAVLDSDAVASFLDWMTHVRSASEGTRSEYLSSLISAVKFLYRDVAEEIKGVRCSRVTVVERYKDARNSLQSVASRKRKSKHDLEETEKWVDWEQDYMPAVEAQQALYDANQGDGHTRDTARLLHDLILLRWQTVGPSRAGEIRTVEFLAWDELSELRGRRSVGQWAQSVKRNVLTKRPMGGRASGGGEDACWVLYLSCYKTSRWTGVDVTELDAALFPELCAALDDYLLGDGEDSRPLRSLLGPRDEHCFVFMSMVGTPLSETYFSTYLASLVERHTGNRPTASVLRSSFVTSMLDGKAGADMRSREALAEQMRHSTREQSRTYDRRSRQKKKRKALELVSTAPPPPVKESTPSSPRPLVAVPFTRDDVVSVPRVEGVTFAKVMRSGSDGLVLMGMRHVEGAYYAVDVTTVWVHRDISVLCFADAVWNREHGYYEMRSHSE